MEPGKVDQLLDVHPLITTMLHRPQMKYVLEQLEMTILDGVEGAVVELGCFEGTTSLFIRRLLDLYRSDKAFHVYDSFNGLPEPTHWDRSKTERKYSRGGCRTTREKLLFNFNQAGIAPPIIHEGWFTDIPDHQFPEKISFAFFDSDFYSSIMDSFNKVYDKLSRNAIVCIHDYGWEVLPGVEEACRAFLQNRAERVTPTSMCIGRLQKA